MTRWHPDDLAGRLIRESGPASDGGAWTVINLPALSEDGPESEAAPLWPERWPKEALLEKKRQVGEYTWASLYQGRPRPRGGAVFGEPTAYEHAPFQWRAAIGIDLAYTKKTSSDYSTIVVMKEWQGSLFVDDVARTQVRAPEFLALLVQYKARYPTARIRWYASGTERGAADFLLAGKVPVEVLNPPGDKFTRAIPYAAGWNARKVLVPEDSGAHPWVDEFLLEHAHFTGVNDEHDDQVDAAGTAYSILAAPAQTYTGLAGLGVSGGGRRM